MNQMKNGMWVGIVELLVSFVTLTMRCVLCCQVVESSLLGKELGICNTVRTEDERFISNSHFGHETNTKMLFL
jgi:hypothetical protein